MAACERFTVVLGVFSSSPRRGYRFALLEISTLFELSTGTMITIMPQKRSYSSYWMV